MQYINPNQGIRCSILNYTHFHISFRNFSPFHWGCFQHNITVTSYGHNGVSDHHPLECLRNRLFRRRSKKTSKLRVTGLCEGNPPVIGGYPSQRASNAESISTWWRHHDTKSMEIFFCSNQYRYEDRFQNCAVMSCRNICSHSMANNTILISQGILIVINNWYTHSPTTK